MNCENEMAKCLYAYAQQTNEIVKKCLYAYAQPRPASKLMCPILHIEQVSM